MLLSRLRISNFRRIKDADVQFDRASFLIGQNNYGKSTVLRAVDLLLTQEVPAAADYRVDDSGQQANEISLEATFNNVVADTAGMRGFKGRVVNGSFTYRKVYRLKSGKSQLERVECLQYPWTLKPEFENLKTGTDLLAAGGSPEVLAIVCGGDAMKTLKKGWEKDVLDEVADFDVNAEPEWVVNPGGIQGNVLSQLPRVLHIPPLTAQGEVGDAGKQQTLVARVLGILFEDLIAANPLAQTLRAGLRDLEAAMSPSAEGSLIRTLCSDINVIIGGVFPGCGIEITPSLDDLGAILKPKYDVSLFSNTSTGVDRQGSGLLRTTVFSMLRYHSQLRALRDASSRPLLVAFEEPELYLHPSAANLLRDTIYELGATDQIICTTHSPWMIDLTKPWQSLSKMVLGADGSVSTMNYGVAAQLEMMGPGDKARVKMLQVFDDELSRVFFAERVVVVEGDTEEIVFKATLRCLPEDERRKILSRVQLVKARGKPAIIALVKYLRALRMTPFVIHDRDNNTPGAAVFNEPIAQAVGDASLVCMLEECVEDILGYKPPSSDKPYKAFSATSGWSELSDVPAEWRTVFEKAVETPVMAGTGAPPVAKVSTHGAAATTG